MRDFFRGCLEALLSDPFTHLGLLLGGLLIGVGVAALYWSIKWHFHDRRLAAWERRDAELKAAIVQFLGTRPCQAIKLAEVLQEAAEK